MKGGVLSVRATQGREMASDRHRILKNERRLIIRRDEGGRGARRTEATKKEGVTMPQENYVLREGGRKAEARKK